MDKEQITKDSTTLYNKLVDTIKAHQSGGAPADHWRSAYVAVEAVSLIMGKRLEGQTIDKTEIYELAAQLAEKAITAEGSAHG